MRKLIIVSVILCLMLTLGITEIVLTNKLFSSLENGLERVEVLIEKDPKNIDNKETIEEINKVLDLWKSKRQYVFVVHNHINMRCLDEKLITLKKQIEINAEQDAPVTLSVSKNFLKELKQEGYPKIINIF